MDELTDSILDNNSIIDHEESDTENMTLKNVI